MDNIMTTLTANFKMFQNRGIEMFFSPDSQTDFELLNISDVTLDKKTIYFDVSDGDNYFEIKLGYFDLYDICFIDPKGIPCCDIDTILTELN